MFAQFTKITTAGARCGATQIFDLIRGTYVKTVAEQSTLLRCECDALQLTAGRTGVPRGTLVKELLLIYRELTNDVNVFTSSIVTLP